MDKKKIAIIALVFIFLGTMIFAFANPKDEDFKDSSVPSKVDEDKPTDDEQKDEETLGEEEENNNTNVVTNTNGDNNADEVVNVVDYYKLALEAVEKAEGSLVQNDVDSAKDLINNVTTDQKEDLLDRINDVQNIIDFDKLLKVLENKTNSSTNKDELNDARDFNVSNSIADKLDSLKDSTSKTDFEERYNVVLLTLNDVTNPVINGVTEGEYTNRELEIEVVEDSEYVITLDGEAYELGTSIGEGVHVLKVVDKAFNETVVNFTIDRTAPEVTGITQQYEDKEDGRIKVTITTSEEIFGENIGVSDNTGWRKVSATEYYTYYYKTKDVTFNFTDQAGNMGTYSFTIDRTAPKVTGITQQYEDKEDGRIKVTITTSEEIFGENIGVSDNTGWRKVSATEYYTYYYKTKDVTLNFTDKVGNPGTYTFTVDKTAPTIILKKYTKDNKGQVVEPGYYNFSLVAFVEDSDIASIKLNGEDYILGTEIAERKDYVLEVKDKTGNTTTINFTIDKDHPIIEINGTEYKKENGEKIYFKENIAPIIKDTNIESIKLNGENYTSVTEISDEKEYTLEAIDKAGNKTSIVFVIDKTLPVVLENNSTGSNDIFSLVNLKLYDKVGIEKLIIDEKEYPHKGNYIDINDGHITTFEEGNHEIKFIDKAGNENVYKFVVDHTAPSMIVGNTTYGPDHQGIIYSSTRFKATASDLNGVKEIYANHDLRDKIDVNGEGKYTFRLIDMAGNESVFTVIVDKSAPTVTLKKWKGDGNHEEVTPGNHNYYVLAEYSDANLESAKLDGNDYESGALITVEGEHTLIVRDMAGNETPITFTIDRTYPVVKINGESFDHDNQDIKYYKNVEVEIIEENIDSITLTKDGNAVEYNNEYVFEEGKYALTVRDTAKNKTVVNFVVDHTAPSMIVGNTTYGPDHEGIIYSSTRFKAVASDLNGVKEIYANHDLRDKIDVNGEGKYTFRLIDMAGNESKFTVIVDKTNPNPSVVEILTLEAFKGNTEYAKSGKTIRVYLTFKEELSSQRNGILGTYFGLFKVNGEELPLRKDSYNEETKEYNYIASYTIPEDANIEEGILPWSVEIFGDMAGNTIDPITKTVNARPGRTQIIYDNTIPGKVSTTYTPSDLTNQDVTVTIRVNEVITPVDGWNLSDDKMAISKTFSENTNGNVVISDLAGNSEIRYYSIDNIDKESPVVDTLRVKGLKEGQGTTNFKKIKVGDTFQVILTTVEELGTLPVLMIDGKEVNDVKVNKFDTYYQYIVSYIIPEDTTLIDGEQIAFVLKGYTDKAGNPGIELTNDNIKIGNGQTEVIFDKSAPVISIDRNITLHVGDNFVDDIREKIFDNVTSVENLYVGGGWGTFKDTSVAGNYHLNYKIMDEAGNYSVATRNITVIEP